MRALTLIELFQKRGGRTPSLDAELRAAMRSGRSGSGGRSFHFRVSSLTRENGSGKVSSRCRYTVAEPGSGHAREDLEGPPLGLQGADREALIEALDQAVQRVNGKLAINVHVELPAAFSPNQRAEVLTALVARVETAGFPVLAAAVHRDGRARDGEPQPQPHAHLVVSARPAIRQADGTWSVEPPGTRGKPGRPGPIAGPAAMQQLRAEVAELINQIAERDHTPIAVHTPTEGEMIAVGWHGGRLRDTGIERPALPRRPVSVIRAPDRFRDRAGPDRVATVDRAAALCLGDSADQARVTEARQAWAEAERRRIANGVAKRAAEKAAKRAARAEARAETAARVEAARAAAQARRRPRRDPALAPEPTPAVVAPPQPAPPQPAPRVPRRGQKQPSPERVEALRALLQAQRAAAAVATVDPSPLLAAAAVVEAQETRVVPPVPVDPPQAHPAPVAPPASVEPDPVPVAAATPPAMGSEAVAAVEVPVAPPEARPTVQAPTPAPDLVADLVAEREAAALAAVEAARATVRRLDIGRWTSELDAARASLIEAESSDWLPPVEDQPDRRAARAKAELRKLPEPAVAPPVLAARMIVAPAGTVADLARQGFLRPDQLLPPRSDGTADRSHALQLIAAMDPIQLQKTYAIARALEAGQVNPVNQAVAAAAVALLRQAAAAREQPLDEPKLGQQRVHSRGQGHGE